MSSPAFLATITAFHLTRIERVLNKLGCNYLFIYLAIALPYLFKLYIYFYGTSASVNIQLKTSICKIIYKAPIVKKEIPACV